MRGCCSMRGSYLYALNPKTGELIRDFGDRGRADLRRQTREKRAVLLVDRSDRRAAMSS